MQFENLSFQSDVNQVSRFKCVQFSAFSFPLLSTHGLAVDDFASGALPKLRVPGGTSDVGFMQRILKVSGER
jgi:hypothetical protein